MGLGPLCGIGSAFVMGYISDRVGRKTILQVSLLLWSLAFFGYIWADRLWMVAALHMLYGACRASFEAVATALLTDITPEHLRKKVFHLRYYAINIGACIGPPIGSWLLLQNGTQGFWFTAVIYFLYFLLFQYFVRLENPQVLGTKAIAEKLNLSFVVRTLQKDRSMFLFLLASMLMMLGFAQLETTLPQYLQMTHGNLGIKLLVYINLTNALTIVFFQFPLTAWTKSISLLSSIKMGFFTFAAGFMSFAFFADQPLGMMFSMFILTFGEMMVFSNMYVWMDHISPKNLKGSYFGILELTTLGFVIGPFIGGWILEKAGVHAMFITLGVLSFISIFLIHWSNYFYQKHNSSKTKTVEN